jgi:hypothetical protein
LHLIKRIIPPRPCNYQIKRSKAIRKIRKNVHDWIDPPSQGPGGNHGHESFQFTNLSEESSTIQSKLARSTCKDQIIIKKSGFTYSFKYKEERKEPKRNIFGDHP